MSKWIEKMEQQLKYMLEDENVPEYSLSGRSVGQLIREIIDDAEEEGMDEALTAYLDENPHPTFDELWDYRGELLPPLEVVDDEELSEEERTD